MIRILKRELGFRVTLWVHPFASPFSTAAWTTADDGSSLWLRVISRTNYSSYYSLVRLIAVRAVAKDCIVFVGVFFISLLGMYRIADFTIRPNKNNSFYYSAEYE